MSLNVLNVSLNSRIDSFRKLGEAIRKITPSLHNDLFTKAYNENPWFTTANTEQALNGIARMLDADKLNQWTSHYKLRPSQPKTVAIVAAGNIPLVSFHDILCVLVSGHRLQVKTSSKDNVLVSFLLETLTGLEPQFRNFIEIHDGKLHDFDAVIATGSDNASRYFDYYFSKYPHIIRRNRTSCAILNGNETADELRALGNDIFSYFGLGCRNVSKLFIPENYPLAGLIPHWQSFKDIIHHSKYANNYDYQKSILLVNKLAFLDGEHVLLREETKLVSPIAVLYYEYYQSKGDLLGKIESAREKIQCIVGNAPPATILFGEAQYPEPWDYADGVDTLKFLSTL